MSNNDNLCWYHKTVTREEADEKLKNAGNGVFLVRDSNTSPGDYVLSVFHNLEVFHYQIRHHGEDAFYSIDDQTPIHGLDSLIEHYRENPEGLVTRLLDIYPGGGQPPAESRRHGRQNLLHRATKNGHLVVVEEMLNSNNKTNKYPLDAKDQDGRSAVHLACLLEKDGESILEMLINSGANVNCRDEEGNTPLHYACRTKPVSLIKMLVDAQAHIDARNNDTWRVPLHEAASYGNLEAVKYLLELNAPHLPRSLKDETPVQLAIQAGHRETVAFLEKYRPPEPTLERNQYWHGTMDRAESERLIRKYVKDNNLKETESPGTFLVRHSMREKKNILGVLNEENQFKNYVIEESDHHLFYIDEGPYMHTLEHLIQHYMRFSDGLPTKLRHAVPPKDKPPLPPPSTLPTPKKIGILKKTLTLKTNKEVVNQQRSPKERNLSLPSDELLNDNNHNDAPSPSKESTRKPSLPGSLNLNTLKRKLLGKDRPKGKKESSVETENSSEKNIKPTLDSPLSLSISALTFKGTEVENSEVYNVPSSKPVVQARDMENGNALSTNSLDHGHNDIDLFTQSDNRDLAHTEPELFKEECIYFVDAPTKRIPLTMVYRDQTPSEAPFFPHVDNGIPTTNGAFDALNGNAKYTASMPESHLSVDSIASLKFDMMLAIQNASNKHNPDYYIPGSIIERIERLGRGQFGDVWKCSMKCEGQNGEMTDIDVAVKLLIDAENSSDFLREAFNMKNLQHHCIVKMIGISKGPPLMIVQELVPHGALSEYLEENRANINPNLEFKIWASQIACGMNYLESKHFVHRDLAARNILVMSRQQVKISDFGLSRALGADDDYYQAKEGGRWPIKWYPPECTIFGTFSHAGDVWSFGVTLWEMYTFGETPYGDIEQKELIPFLEGGGRLRRPELCPLHIFEIMQGCWNFNPKHRPTFRYLTQFFSSDPDYQNVVEILKQQNAN